MDPMCSWCWGFYPVFTRLLENLPVDTPVQYVMGGLAPDTDEPMPEETREYVQSQWRAVSEKTGAQFNWNFWTQCQPRRATYPACRAVIAAGLQRQAAVPEMIHAIQQAYYRQARNPSDEQTLIELAGETGLDQGLFKTDLNSATVYGRLQSDFRLRNDLGVTHFPSVLLEKKGQRHWLATGDIDIGSILDRLSAISGQ